MGTDENKAEDEAAAATETDGGAPLDEVTLRRAIDHADNTGTVAMAKLLRGCKGMLDGEVSVADGDALCVDALEEIEAAPTALPVALVPEPAGHESDVELLLRITVAAVDTNEDAVVWGTEDEMASLANVLEGGASQKFVVTGRASARSKS